MDKIKEQDAKDKPQSLKKLRELGKFLNIKSPTSLSKEQLIEKIAENAMGNGRVVVGSVWNDNSQRDGYGITSLETLNKNTRKQLEKEIEAREQHYEFELSQCLETVQNYVVLDTKRYSKTSLSTSIKQYAILDDKNDEIIPNTSSLIHYFGYIDIEDNKWIIKYLGYDRRVTLLEEQVRTYKFERYDNVEFTVFYSEKLNKHFLLDVIGINGLSYVKEGNYKPFEQLMTKPPKNVYKFNNISSEFLSMLTKIAPIAEGGRVLVWGDNERKRTQIMHELTRDFVQNGVETFPIYIDCLNEEEYFIKNSSRNAVFVGLSETPEQKMEKILLAYFRAEKFVEHGQNAVVLINDFNALYNILESMITVEKVNYIVGIALKFFNVGGLKENDGSLTCVTFMNGENLRLLERLKQSASLIVPLKDSEEVYPVIDICNIENKLANFYMDEDAATIAGDIKRVVESRAKTDYEPIIKTLAKLNGADSETLLSLIKNL